MNRLDEDLLEDDEQRELDDEESDERAQAFADLDSFEDINY